VGRGELRRWTSSVHLVALLWALSFHLTTSIGQTMNIAFIGYGQVGAPIADHLQRLGHRVVLAATDVQSDSVKRAQTRNPSLLAQQPKVAVEQSDIVFLATPFAANKDALANVADELRGKILVDCTNPVGPGLTHGLDNKQSGTEMIQAMLPKTRVVKAFSIYGFENFENNRFAADGVQPAMLFCGNDAGAKAVVAQLLTQLGWRPVDVGGAEQALHLEHMTLLWVRMARVQGHHPHFVWAMLER